MTEATPKKSSTAPTPPRPLKLWQDLPGNQEVQIELVPLIDVIFCILTFFILAAVDFTRQQAINLDLPAASTGKPQMREMLIVSLDGLGQVYVEQNAVTQNQLNQIIRDYHQLNPEGLMVLHAAKDASYSEVVNILDALRAVGGDRVALATLPESGSNGTPTPTNPDLAPNNQLPDGLVNPALPNSSPGLDNVNPVNPDVPPLPNATPGNDSDAGDE